MDYVNPKLILETADLEPGSITWKSPSNLAIVKYWGKHGTQLPKNPSISLTLENAQTQTTLTYRSKEVAGPEISLEFLFQEEPQPVFAEKIAKFLTSLLPVFPFLQQLDLSIHSENSFPHSAGIASSASSMSALALCLCSMEDNLFHTLSDDEEFDRKASYISRLGSGSACRSIYPYMSLWGQQSGVDGSSDLFAIPMEEEIDPIFKTLHDDILIISKKEKAVSSSQGHALMDHHPFAEARFNQARQNIHFLIEALKSGDLETFGRIAESEALTLHALMMASNPGFFLIHPNTITMIEKVRQFRAETTLPVFFSLDAGPNLHLLYPESIIHDVRLLVETELAPLCEDQYWLPDWAGEGPEQL
ncbi:MAG: diphosphomevalonate decarboxylase [Saprospirales bacterium]|nr:diphosphomevalonate decarboxylase [Saprospirales bacterium]